MEVRVIPKPPVCACEKRFIGTIVKKGRMFQKKRSCDMEVSRQLSWRFMVMGFIPIRMI